MAISDLTLLTDREETKTWYVVTRRVIGHSLDIKFLQSYPSDKKLTVVLSHTLCYFHSVEETNSVIYPRSSIYSVRCFN